MLAPMRRALSLLLVLAPIASALGAGQRAHSFHVGALVVRSARVGATAGRIQMTAARPVAVSIDSAPPRLATGDVALPPGAVRVTVNY